MLAQLVQDLVHLERRGQRLDQHRRARCARGGGRARPRSSRRRRSTAAPRGGAPSSAGRSRRRGRARAGGARSGRRTGRSRTARPTTARRRRAGASPAGASRAGGRAAWRGPRRARTPAVARCGRSIVPSIASIRLTWPPTWLRPRRGVGVLEVGHEAARAGVERVDHELAVGRAGDLDAPVERSPAAAAATCQSPSRISRVSAGSRACRRRQRAARARRAAAAPGGGRSKRACSSATKASASGVRIASVRVLAGGVDVETAVGHGRVPRMAWSSRVIGWKMGSVRSPRCAAIWSAQPGFAAATASAPGRGRLRGLARAELRRGLRLDEVVDAGRAAAQLPLGRLEQLEAGDRAQQARGCCAHLLGVGEVAGVVVGDAQRQRMARRALVVLGEELVHVARSWPRRPPPGRPSPGRRQQVRVVLHARAAAGHVDHDRLEAPRRRRSSPWRARAPRPRRRRAAAASRSSAARAARAPRSPRR